MNFTEYEDALIAALDKDKEYKMTIEQTISNIKAGDVVSLSYYRSVVTNYMGWKPLSMKDYVAKLNGTRFQAMQLELELQRKRDNDKVKRANRLTTKPKN